MIRHLRLSAAALGLSVLLLLPAGPCGAMAEEEDEIAIDLEADGIIEPSDIGALDLAVDLDTDLAVDLVAPEAPTPEPTKTPKPTRTPAPTKKPEEKPPWLTSPHYPKDKINFENEIWGILTQKWGLEAFQAAGLMSSIQAESSFCPYNVQGMGGSDDRGAYLYNTGDSVGFGLCQWTSSGRKANLLSFAASRGSRDLVWDFDTQMAFMQRELDMNALKATKTLYEAAEWTVMRYERPNQRYANSWPGTRYEKGCTIYRKHTGKAYEEPALEFSVYYGDNNALEAGALALSAEAMGRLTVSSNYYWRLTQVDADTVEEKPWLAVKAPSFYYPTVTEDCVCGYAGQKALALSVVQHLEPGKDYAATLRFEIYRGKHEIRTVKIIVTGPQTPAEATEE